jgi:hypothetical protein
MSIYSVARGKVVGAPCRVTTEAGDATVLVLSDPLSDKSGVEYQVSCRDAQLGQHVIERVRLGDRLVVLGTWSLDLVSGPLEDRLSAARITLIADTLALDLDTRSGRAPSNEN